MNHTTLKQIEENLRISETIISRIQMLFRAELTDPGYDLLAKLSQAQADVKSYISNLAFMEKTNGVDARAEDLKRWIKHNPEASAERTVEVTKIHLFEP